MIANQIAGFLGVAGAVAATDYESIATVTVGAGGTSTVTFSSIPSTYTHLQVRFIARTSNASTGDGLAFRYNSDTGNNYNYHYVFGDGSTTGASGSSVAVSKNIIYRATGASAGASMFGAGIVDILDYKNTSKYKTARNLGGADSNGSGISIFTSGLWLSTSAITQIDITSDSSSTIQQYSSFALYGIK
jgi:hypothetical protein